MKLRYKLSGLLVLILSGLLWLHFKRPIKSIVLPSGHSTDTLALSDYGHGIILTPHKDGTVTAKPKAIGMPFDIGMSGALSGRETQLYLTTEIFYYRHFELLAGLGISYPIIHLRAMAAVGYRLPWKRVDNISVFVGHDLQHVIVGVYARFGSN